MEYKYLVKEIVIATGAAAGTSRSGQKITAGYERVIGIAINEVTNGGNATYKVGFSDDNKTYVDPIPVDLLKTSSAVKMEDRFLPVDIQGNNNEVYTDIVLPAIPASEFKLQVVFKVIKGEIVKNC